MYHRFFAYGLNIDSALTLPELLSKEVSLDPPDIKICLGKIEPHPHTDETGRGFWVRGNQACYSLRKVGVFLVTAGQHILVEPHPGVTEELLRLCILGPALALALHQRGLFILHASAISMGGTGVAFLGGHGWGKSTIAAILHARGHPVISDDMTALNVQDHTVVPSFPQLKLWPDTLRTLGLSPDEVAQIHPDSDKRVLRCTHCLAPCPLPLRRLYVLGIGQPTAIEMVPTRQALEEIIRYWYGARFGPAFLDSLDLREYFLRATQLAHAIPVRRLRRPATLLNDPDLPKTIEREILQDLEYSKECA